MYSIGVDIGYSSMKVVVVDECERIVFDKYLLHKGKVEESFNVLKKLLEKSFDLKLIKYGSFTGSASKVFKSCIHVNEVTALVEGSLKMNDKAKAIVEIGGENTKFITDFFLNDKSKIKISMNPNCSAGTGSFIEEQVSRLNIDLKDYSKIAERAKVIPRIAGRCSVFAKSDITHHLQEGVKTSDILKGLSYALVKNYKNSVIKRQEINKPVMLVGGVAYNNSIVEAIKDVLSLTDDELILSDNFSTMSAFGCAIIAREKCYTIDFMSVAFQEDSDLFLQELPSLNGLGDCDYLNKHNIELNGKFDLNCYLGIDVGSTSTNLVLIDERGNLVDLQYLKTYGNPSKAISDGFNLFKDKYGTKLTIKGVGVTGSGRYSIGKLVGADVIKDEITAQARASVEVDEQVDTIFEIGGQDSKFISLDKKRVCDFQMNKICAAGTGSFIEEQSKKFNIDINDFGALALESDYPINLGERCTVFIETSIVSHLSKGASIKDIAAGLCYSIVNNYLNRVVGKKKIGDRILLQGGIAYNQGIINAFRAITHKKIIVPPFFSVTGAFGVALLAKEEKDGELSTFKGFELIYNNERISNDLKIVDSTPFNDSLHNLIFTNNNFIKERKTVGFPRALFTYGMYPMFSTFFSELGFNTLISPKTDENIIELSQKYSLDETCYPLKLINGHIAKLIEKGVDFIFFPDLFTVEHPLSHVRADYGCPYMQSAYRIIKKSFDDKENNIKFLHPTIAFNQGPAFMKQSFLSLSETLDRTKEDIIEALKKAMIAYKEFEDKIGKDGKKVLSNLKSDEKAFVIVSKIYGVIDPVLNISIPDKLKQMGYKVLSFFDLDEANIKEEHPNMYWPFGTHILEAAKVIKNTPNLYAIYLSHHCCGPDTVLCHYFKEIMEEKPYLNIEVDEHSSSVGVITRVEAFINSLSNSTKNDDNPRFSMNSGRIVDKLNESKKLCLPNLYPYSQIAATFMSKKGLDVEVLSPSDGRSLSIGRKHIMTNEYLSLTALLGDSLKFLKNNNYRDVSMCVLKTEGAEVDGQYSRMLRLKMDELDFDEAEIFSMFVEDLIKVEDLCLEKVFLTLLAGDFVRAVDKSDREIFLKKISSLIENDALNLERLILLAKSIDKRASYKKKILALGEIGILYNDCLNNHHLVNLENSGYKIFYAPLSEYMLMFWQDYLNQHKEYSFLQKRIDNLKSYILRLSKALGPLSPFERNLDGLFLSADKFMGLYCGNNGRYRMAKLSTTLDNVDGIITVASLYENTSITLNILQDNEVCSKPVLNLSFDGSLNENDKSKLDSFIYYL